MGKSACADSSPDKGRKRERGVKQGGYNGDKEIGMTGKYDITKDRERIGSLSVEKQGGYTLFSADCGPVPGIFRLSVYGQGREGYLGVMIPEHGRLRLEKKLSAWALRDFPQLIELVGPAGGMEKKEEPKEETKEEPAPTGSGVDSRPSMDEDGPFWYASPDGALFSADSGREMLALPPGDARAPQNIPGENRVIEGKEYLVYITKELDR